MARATLTPNVKITDEYGVTFDQAMVLTRNYCFNDQWCADADIDEELKEEASIGGGTYKAWYYCSPQARALGVPLKPLRTYEDGVFSDVLIIDGDAPEIKQLFSNASAKGDKAPIIARKDLELRFR